MKDLPPAWPRELRSFIGATLRARAETLLVLDDDATGTQTVHGIPILLRWEPDDLRATLDGRYPAIYLLTNSRSLTEATAVELNSRAIKAIAAAWGDRSIPPRVVSRSDSTLRGHYPAETDVISAEVSSRFGFSYDGVLLVPFFEEGGRLTIHDTHWVVTGGDAIPIGESEFARDPVFGFRASSLPFWVAEKSKGRIPPEKVERVTLEDIRLGGPKRVRQKLLRVTGGIPVVVNAASCGDLEVVIAGLLEAEASGKNFLYRTAASFVPIRAGILPRPLLSPSELSSRGGTGGLVVVGSYIQRSTVQLAALLERPGTVGFAVHVQALLDHSRATAEVTRVTAEATDVMRSGDIAVIYTSRAFVDAESTVSRQDVARTVSHALVAIVRGIRARPRYVLTKGGITASDIATEALGARRALVLGQILPGVPVWQLDEECLYPHTPYVVFPGNVGGPDALAKAVGLLKLTGVQTAEDTAERDSVSA
ncbi:MAG TPA: four-carbon acid sugar kinase family protein [bacterium]|nr:four-carbon acid sugar kinase family protein [bacterium]